MSRKSARPQSSVPRGSSKRASPSIILAFGEDRTDTEAIATLIKGLRPDLPAIAIRQRPIILSRAADEKKRRSVAADIAKLVKAEIVGGKSVSAVVAHRDLDGVEQDDTLLCKSPGGSNTFAQNLKGDIENELAKLGTTTRAVAVVAAYEIEAWWLMWPSAVAAHRPSWNKLIDRKGKRVDKIVDAKETLRRELRPSGDRTRVPDYSPSDGPMIAKHVVRLSLAKSPRGVCLAYERLGKEVQEL